jgi:competence protein ComEC
MFMLIVTSLIRFWSCHPALYYGIAFLLGLFFHLEGSVWLIIPCLFLWLPFFIESTYSKHREGLKPLALGLLTFFTAWCYVFAHYSFPHLPPEGILGKGYVKIKNVTLQHSLFGVKWLYHCELQQFFPDNLSQSIVSSLPCLISLPAGARETKPRPLADHDYWVSGKLIRAETGSYHLKVSNRSSWTVIQNSWSLSERRYQWKKKVSEWIRDQFSRPLSASFLAGLATGQFDDFWMRQQFARFGLQHLLAVSGFHFAIMAGFLSFLLRLFLSQRVRLIALLLFLGAYCFFLGPQASILRAWIMCSLTLCGGLIEKQTTALNSLGIALLIILGYNPLICQELGFQLSFTTAAAILLFYQPALTWLNDLFPKRKLSEVLTMNLLNQHGYCFVAFLRQGLALTLAVNVFAMPLTLFYFHQFPSMSFLYNLFFPFLASVSLFLLLLGGFLTFLPFLSENLHRLNNAYTDFLLQLTYQVPSEVDVYFTLESFPPVFIILYICCASLAGILWRERVSENSQEGNFAFI